MYNTNFCFSIIYFGMVEAKVSVVVLDVLFIPCTISSRVDLCRISMNPLP